MTWGHVILGLAMQALAGLSAGEWWLGAAAAAALFIGREHAQAEYRWIETFGLGRRANMPWWGGFDPRVWRGHPGSFFDWLAPLVAVVILALAVG